MKKICFFLFFFLFLFGCSEEKHSNEIIYEPINTGIYVEIKGCVHTPGVYFVSNTTRLYQLISYAGGVTLEADTSSLNLTIPLNDSDSIVIPSIYLEQNEKNEHKININTASKEELMTLPGIKEALALNILKYRKENGFFKSTEEIMKVVGIKTAKYEEIKEYITV